MCAVHGHVSWVVYPTVLGLKPFGAGSKRNSYMRALTIYGGFNNISLNTYEPNTNYNKHKIAAAALAACAACSMS